MNKIFGLAIVAVGIALVIFGISAADSLASSFSRFFTGSPTDKSIWMLIGGAVLITIGAVGFARGAKDG